MEDDNELLLEALNEVNRLQRQHASIFNWGCKAVKEAGITDEFLNPEVHCGRHSFTSFEPLKHGEDPPDAWVFGSNGNRTALEIAELVNQSTIEAQINGDELKYRDGSVRWADLAYFKRHVNEIVSTKDAKCGRLFSKGVAVQLLLHSDETYLLASYRDHLNQELNLTCNRFERVWLLLSYDPKIKKCPLMELT